MNKLTRGIGSLIVVLFMYSVPVVLGYAFAAGWNGFFEMLFVCCALVQIGFLTDFVYREGE